LLGSIMLSRFQVVQHGLIVGISGYSSPVPALPAVANDVREMAKLLTSKNGAFQEESVTTLADKAATRNAVLASLNDVFSKTSADETVFVYLAGHGTVSSSSFFFLPHDVDVQDIENSCIPLTTIKSLFDGCKSRRVFLWMDFCHSGGILARGSQGDAISTLRRTLQVVQGQGKIIVAACTSSQSAFESPALGHGLFTHALLRGIKGEAKSAHGEVTAASLYDFIDHQVANPDQQPVFFGEMTGRIVLMHFDKRTTSTPAASPAEATPGSPKSPSKGVKGPCVLLGDSLFLADRVRNHSDGSISVELIPRSGEEEARIAALRPEYFGSRSQLPFAANNDACEVEVEEIVSDYIGSQQRWTLTLRASRRPSGFATEMTVNGVGPDEIAKMRAGRILLNNPPPRSDGAFEHDSLLESTVSGGTNKYQANECVVQEVFRNHNKVEEWMEIARLKAVFLLKITGTVEHVIELVLGPVRGNKIKVSFKGRRAQRYSNREPETIQITGECELG
jgi:hypothetical protein